MQHLKTMASQSHAHSLLESIINVIVGLGINIVAQVFIFPLFGIHIPFSDNLRIAGLFTIISIGRSFCLRRVFNWVHIRKL